MEEASFMEHVKTAPSSDSIFQNPLILEEEDDSFVPESLRAFMQDANAKLDQDLSDILDGGKNSIVASTQDQWMEDDEDDMDEDAPPPEFQEVHIPLMASASASMTTASSIMTKRDDRNDVNHYEHDEEDEPILAKLEQMDFVIPTSSEEQHHQHVPKSYEQMTTRDLLKPKPIPDPDALEYTETEDEPPSQFFQDILQQEQDLSLKHDLMMGLLDEDAAREREFKARQRKQQELQEQREQEKLKELQRRREQHYYQQDEESSIPPLESMNNAPTTKPSKKGSILEAHVFEDYDDDDEMLEELLGDKHGGMNPAAFLTAGQAKDMALDGVVPPALEPDSDDDERMPPNRNLSAQLLQAEKEFGTPKNPSPPKRPKLEGMDAMLAQKDSEDYDKIEPEMANLLAKDDDDNEMERSYISSTSSEEFLPTTTKPLSPPTIVHQTDTPPSLQEAKQTLQFQPNITASVELKTANRLQPPMPELPTRDLLKEAMDIQAKVTQQFQPKQDASAKLLDFLHPNINEMASKQEDHQQQDTTPVKKPPSGKQQQTPERPQILTPPSMSRKQEPSSPDGAVGNLFDYLHPSGKQKSSNPSQQQRKQLFSGPPTVEAKKDKQQPATEVTITHSTPSKTTNANNSQAFSPSSSIGFGSPTSELRRKRQEAMAATSPASTPSRKQGHSPLVHKKHPPRELTHPDKNIPSRLLQGTAAFRAKQARGMGKSSIKSMAKSRVASKSGTSTDPPADSSRFLQPTQASRRLTSRNHAESEESTTASSPSKMTAPVASTSRLLQPTQASQAQTSREDPMETDQVSTTSSNLDQKASRARLRERMASRARGTNIIQSNREKKEEQKKHIKSTMDRVRERRERLARIEQERVAKLKAKIAERDRKVQERKAKMEAERTSPVKAAAPPPNPKTAKSSIPRPLTIPKAPNFLTDKRLKRQEKPKEEMIPLANADAVLMRSFRDDHSISSKGERKLTIPKTPNLLTKQRAGDPQEAPKEEMIPLANADAVFRKSFRDDSSMGGGSPARERRPTIPKTPNLITTQKYGDKNSAAKRTDHDDEGSVHHWQDGLRTATSPSNKSVCSQLTIPQTPNFQPSRKREAVMSTAEREQAEMDYFRAHPFKAKPVGSGVKTYSVTKSQVEKRKLTVPKPFHLSGGNRTTTPDHRESTQPKTLFPAPRGTPVDGFTMKAKRTTTTPKPFRLSTSRRQSSSPTESGDGDGPPQDIAVKATKKFHARPMPKFDTVSIPVRDKDPSKLRSPPPKQPEEVKPFKARGVPKSLFKTSIPVRDRDPSKLRSPDYIKTSPEYLMRHGKGEVGMTSPDSSESKPFRAKPAPFRSPPSIPVRDRDPHKLRPVETKTFPAPPSLAGSSNASSLEARVDKRKAVRENMKQRMKGRRGKAAIESVATSDSSQVGPSLDTTGTTSTDGVSSSYGESSVSTSFADTPAQAIGKVDQRASLVGATSPNSEREKSLLEAAMKKWPKSEAASTAVPTAASEAPTPVTKGGQSNKEELRNAIGGWMFDSVPATAAIAGLVKGRGKPALKPKEDKISEIRRAEPDPLEMARLAEEKRKHEERMKKQNMSKTYEETTQLAVDLQKQLEDALSFEATYSAGDDLDQGYIGQPAAGLGRFDL